jgi:GH24 family phage-related lysozyme (muramidase)
MVTQEKVNAKTTQSNESEAPVGNVQKMAPPAFQLKADPVQRKPEGEGEGGADGVPAEFMEHLKLREGWRTKVYLDSRGLPTVGLGHLLSSAEKQKYPVGTSVPENLLNSWATHDAKKAYDAASDQAGTLGVASQSFKNALASVNFQLGTAWNTKFKKTWGYMTKGEWEKAALECQDSAWYAQTPVRVQDFQAALRALAGKTTPKPAESASSGTYDFKIGAATGSGTSTGDGVNVRKGPGTEYDKTGNKLSKGNGVTIYGEAKGWYCIGQGQWVSKDFVSTSAAKAAPTKDGVKPAGPDVAEIAKAVWEGMFGGYTGLGTDEEAVYNSLAKLKHDGALISAFKAAYKKAHGTDVVTDIKSEFSNSMIFGNQLDKALGYLNASGGGAPAKKAPVTEGAAKEATPKAKAPAAKAPTGASSKFDVAKAVAALNANAEPGSLGKCAKYVRLAINAGGIATPGNPVSACNYNPYLEKLGFKQVSTTTYEKGDIAVFEAFQGDKKYHEHGHIQMWNGTQWVSDFKQRDYWAGPDYRKHKPGSVVYRM